jgi:SAM-dependent methyltransferase
MYNSLAQVYNFFRWEQFSQNIFAEFKKDIKRWQIGSHADLACGTGDFVSLMSDKGVASIGFDNSKAMLNIAKKRYPNLNFKYGDMREFSLENEVDLITCLYDSINHLLNFKEWKSVFNSVYDNLNKNGKFLFDFNSIEFIKKEEEVNYMSLKDKFLMIEDKKIGENKKEFNIEYFIQMNKDCYFRRRTNIKEASFEYKKVKKALLNTGFRDVKLYSPESQKNKKSKKRLFVLAEKGI